MVKGFAAFLPMPLSLVHSALSGHCDEAFLVVAPLRKGFCGDDRANSENNVVSGFSFLKYTKTYTSFTC